MKNIIKHYTKETEKKLTEQLKAFIQVNRDGRAVFLTITTTKMDPLETKGMLKRWLARIGYRYEMSGIYVLEFTESSLVHYHLLLVLSGDLGKLATQTVADKLWEAWKTLGPHKRQAFNLEPADLRHPDWILCYMPKADLEPGIPHPERPQKNLPVRFKTRGLGARWWGVIGRSLPSETDLEAAA